MGSRWLARLVVTGYCGVVSAILASRAPAAEASDALFTPTPVSGAFVDGDTPQIVPSVSSTDTATAPLTDLSPPAEPPRSANCAYGDPPARWFDELSVFGGLDGAKQPQDLGINADLGGRFSTNWGHSLIESLGIGVQLGVGYDVAANAVNVLGQIGGPTHRNQLFSTFGVFQRTDAGFNWAVGHDFLNEWYYDNFFLSQWRASAGYQLTQRSEIGVWATVHDNLYNGSFLNAPLQLRALNMTNFFLRHNWAYGAQTTVWAGIAEGHSEVVYILPGNQRSGIESVFGSTLFVPLNERWALFGQANLIMPAATGTVDAYLGLSYYFGRGSINAPDRRFSPLLPVANNTTFAVDFSR